MSHLDEEQFCWIFRWILHPLNMLNLKCDKPRLFYYNSYFSLDSKTDHSKSFRVSEDQSSIVMLFYYFALCQMHFRLWGNIGVCAMYYFFYSHLGQPLNFNVLIQLSLFCGQIPLLGRSMWVKTGGPKVNTL